MNGICWTGTTRSVQKRIPIPWIWRTVRWTRPEAKSEVFFHYLYCFDSVLINHVYTAVPRLSNNNSMVFAKEPARVWFWSCYPPEDRNSKYIYLGFFSFAKLNCPQRPEKRPILVWLSLFFEGTIAYWPIRHEIVPTHTATTGSP